MSAPAKHDFLALSDFSRAEWPEVFARAAELKAARRDPARAAAFRSTLAGKAVALVFEKASTRTRVSFEVGLRELGADVVVMQAGDSQLGRGEPPEDTARVLSRYVHAIMLRTFGDDRLRKFARAASVPVLNGLSDIAHPLQVATDLFTILERRGDVDPASLRGLSVAFVGDGTSNMALSWIEAAELFELDFRLAAPKTYMPPDSVLERAKRFVRCTDDPHAAVRGADVVNTDVWTSMGMEGEAVARRRAFRGFSVDDALMQAAKPEAFVLHCLPAHRGEEISASVLEGNKSAVWDQAENRLHVQKAIVLQIMREAAAESPKGNH